MSAALPLIGHRVPEARFLAARASGRLHHGWILQGPSGVGKARFAKRIAALMLGADSADAQPHDPVMQKVLSGSHPDLKWVQREVGDRGKLRQDITVDQIRSLNQFFALRPALAGWRVGVIDSLDEMNVSGLNALLKTLEEPPQNALLLLISHGAVPVLPTINSRCQRLRFAPLSAEDTRAVLAEAGRDTAIAADLAGGRPGYGLQLQDGSGAAALQATRTLLKSIRQPKGGVVTAALQAASKDQDALQVYTDALLAWVSDAADEAPQLGDTWMALHRVRADAVAFNQTPLQTATKLFSVLQDGVKALPANP
ncbi:MAG: DNA polymerase III subunit delta' [Pseudomonadota bacterium]